MTFSIIVVCLNAGKKLRETIESILGQTERDYEIIIKDGGSTDEITKAWLDNYRQREQKNLEQGATHLVQEKEHLEEDSPYDAQIRVYCGKDVGIYDAMNQAVQYVRGDYVLFLNCGDRFYDNGVLARVKKQISRVKEQTSQGREQISQVKEQITRTKEQTSQGREQVSRVREQTSLAGVHTSQEGMQSGRSMAGTTGALPGRYIFYGNIYEQRTDTFVQSNPVIDDFACYRNVPCHQVCFYAAGLLREKPFDTAYAVRADYEQFLWCYYRGHARTVYMPLTVAIYEGGGFSETRENEKKSQREHRKIVSIYMPAAKVRKYRLIMLITLAPLRTWIAGNPVTAGIYQTIKRKLYRR